MLYDYHPQTLSSSEALGYSGSTHGGVEGWAVGLHNGFLESTAILVWHDVKLPDNKT